MQIREQLEAAGKAIDPAALQMLVDRSGGDISKLRGDVERLVLYTEGEKKITRGDVEEVVVVETDVDDWAVVNAIGDGDAARALRETALRFDRGDSPHALVGQLRWWVSQRLGGLRARSGEAGAGGAAQGRSCAEEFRRRGARPARAAGD